MSGRRPPSATRRATVATTAGDIDDLEVRVRRRLEPDQAGPLGQRLPQRVLARGQVQVARVDPGAAPDPLEVAERAAVDVVADEDLVARPGELGDRGGDGRPGGEGDPVGAALQRRDRPLEAFAGRVLRAGVLVAAARPADAVLGEGRGLVDRRGDRAGQLVGLGAGMDRERVEGGRQPPRPAVQVEHELLAVDVVELDADLAEAEAADDRERRDVVGRDRRPEPLDALAACPVEHRPHDLGGDTLAAICGLDPVADLDPAVGPRRLVEADRPDDPAGRRPARPGRSPGRATAGRPDRSRGHGSGIAGRHRARRGSALGRSPRSPPRRRPGRARPAGA